MSIVCYHQRRVQSAIPVLNRTVDEGSSPPVWLQFGQPKRRYRCSEV